MPSISKSGDYSITRSTIFVCIFPLISCTIVPDDKDKESEGKGEKIYIYFENENFKPDEYVESVWEEKVVPLFKEKSVPIGDIIPTWRRDQEAAGEKFGYREKAEGSPWNFRVKGSGIVVAANTKSRASTIDIDLLPGDGNADLCMQIGPVFKDSSIRDSLDFVSFTDFTNQLEFGRLSNALNKVVYQDVVSKLDRNSLIGKKITFLGAFTHLQNSDLIRVTPVVLEVE